VQREVNCRDALRGVCIGQRRKKELVIRNPAVLLEEVGIREKGELRVLRRAA
jgi:hypothetical protein